MYSDHVSVIGNGCVVNPKVVLEEIDMFEADGITTKNLKISGNAHVIMPYHIDLDGAFEQKLGKKNIGTTKRGIGPCYQDKMARIGLRMQDMLDEELFRDKLLNNMIDEGKDLLFEGAQATLLDIDHGTYPYVTSSNCTAGGAITGSGVGMKNVDRVLGVMKAYITRVGSGPMPTELSYESEAGHTLTEEGYEYGVTTGRRRRCGWFDGPIANYASRVNGLTDIALTKLDVLSAFDTIKVCVAYDVDGERYTSVPEHQVRFENAKPIYEELPGWKCDITGCRSFDELPQEAQDYVAFIEDLAHTRVTFIGVGAGREQIINRFWK